MAAGHRVLHYSQPAKFVLQAEDVQSTAQTWKSCCVHSTFCVHSSVHACACLGQWPCKTLTPLGAMVSWSAVCMHTWFASAYKKLLLFSKLNWCTVLKSAYIKNYMSTVSTPLYRSLFIKLTLCCKSDRFVITEFTATKRLCKYIFASLIFVPAVQILVILAFEFVLFCHTVLLGII